MNQTSKTPHILIVEDEEAMRIALRETLLSEGFKVTTAADGERGLEAAHTRDYDLILLDVMMPKVSGFDVCKTLRKNSRSTPILMLTAKGQVEDRVTGLDSGADDYLTKPFSLRELLARIRALLRRTDPAALLPQTLMVGHAKIDLSQRSIQRAGENLSLNEKELGILTLLIQANGAPVSRETILDTVWDYNAYPSTRTVDNFILTLRQKLEANPASPQHLLTVRGKGYRLEL